MPAEACSTHLCAFKQIAYKANHALSRCCECENWTHNWGARLPHSKPALSTSHLGSMAWSCISVVRLFVCGAMIRVCVCPHAHQSLQVLIPWVHPLHSLTNYANMGSHAQTHRKNYCTCIPSSAGPLCQWHRGHEDAALLPHGGEWPTVSDKRASWGCTHTPWGCEHASGVSAELETIRHATGESGKCHTTIWGVR